MDVSPNCTQPRSRTTKDTLFILGPHPPQIQLQFLQDEPLPPPSISEKVVVPEIAASRCDSSTAVLVERKDSGYGGSVSRSSSLAAFGRGIRKVFWRTSPKGPIESAIVTDPPVLDCDIPQDVLDHESWAQDLAERLSLASGPDVAAWLGQLSPNTLFSASESKQERAADTQVTVVNLTEASTSSESLMDTIEEIIFMIPHPVPAQAPSTPTADVTMEVLNEPVMSTTPTNPAQGKAGKSLRHVLSVEQLNKPQPPLPADSIDKRPVPAVPAQTKVAIATSSFNSFTKKLAIGTDFKFGRSLGKGTQQRHRASVQQYFQESTSETALTSSSNSQRRERRSTGPSIERLLDDPSMDSPLPLMASPEEVEGASYVSVKPASKKTSRFFMSLTAASATDMKQRHDKEVRPMSEVLLPHPSLDGEDLSRDIASSCTASLHSHLRHSIPQWEESSSDLWSSLSLEPPEPLFYNKGGSSSASSLGETSSCGSVDSSAVDSSADEWDGLTRMAEHARQQNARYDADLKDLQALLYQVDNSNRSRDTPMHSANTSTGSLCLPSQTSPSDKKESKSIKVLPKKDDYMSHRLSSFSPKLLPISGRTKPRSKSGLSRLSAAYGGGELEVVKQAKFDTPESIARNKEIRKFISQEIYTTELNYLQYMRTIQDVFVEPLFKSLEIDKPFIPKANPLYQLLAHISALMAVSNQLVERLEACVRDEVWSDESSMVGTIFLDAKEPLSIFLKYGQSYGKGMKALRSLMKSKRASIVSVNSMAHMDPNASPRSSVSMPEAPRMDKRRSLPSLFSLNTAPGAPNSVLLESSWTGSSNASAFVDGNPSKMNGTDLTGSTKPRSSHGAASVILREVSEYDRFLQNCARCQETAGRFSLADLLILPIQRVTRYCLLLKDLKKHTAVEHEDYVGLVHALEQVHTLALATNNAQPTSLRL
ncbi:Rho guanine nucleotide exchange factor (GEF) 17 [Mortierella sp. GBA30]|nr:Rho guanine nucleotide exchange factor (GEF) 17 [Mortierella sp. GBA30]